MVEKGTLSAEACSDLIDSYGSTLKQSVEVLRPWAAFSPGHKQIVEDAVSWAKTSVDVGTSWLDMNVKLQGAARESFLQLSRSAQENMSEAQTQPSSDEWVKRWSEVYERGTKTFVESSDSLKAMPAFIDQYKECLKAAAKLYGSLTRMAFDTRGELEKPGKDIEKTKTQVQKAAKKTAAPVTA